MKKYLKLFLVIGWMFVIYYFSNQNGTVSSGLSDRFVNEAYKLFFTSFDYVKFKAIGSFIIRKLAHISEYFVLAILWCSFLKELNVRRYLLYGFILTVIYAGFDEFHQLFVLDRSGSVIDVGIDAFGALLGQYGYRLWSKR